MAKKLKERPYCSGTKTEAAFFGMIRSNLRKLSIRWKPRSDYLLENRRPKKNGGRSKWEYECQICHKWFIRAHIQVDHIVPCGSLNCFEDIGPFVKRLLCEKDGYRALCIDCHKTVTNKERKNKGKK